MTRQQAARLVAAISAAHPRTSVPDETVAVYAKLLEDIPYDVAEKAVSNVLKTLVFWPSVAEIREECARVTQRPSLPALPEPELTELERARNVKNAREYAAKIGKAMP